MAVPKKKKSKSRSKMRKGSNGSYDPKIRKVLVNPTSGEFQLAHHISIDGYYNGKKVIETKTNKISPEAGVSE